MGERSPGPLPFQWGGEFEHGGMTVIYLLEDDDSIRDFVIYTLNSQGMEAKGFPRPSLFWQAVGEQLPSLVLLDIMLPEEDGLSVLKKLAGDHADGQEHGVRQGHRPGRGGG